MGSTFLSLNYHLVFSTKERCSFIDSPWRARLHSYQAGIIKNLEGFPIEVGGTADHVHLLFGLKSTHCLADQVRVIKERSCKWVHETIQMPIFSWQEGYGAFSVSPTQVQRVRRYIQGQEAHHRHRTFKEEFREMLIRSGIPFDERYLN